MKRIVLAALLAIVAASPVFGQKPATGDSSAAVKPKYWSSGATVTIGFSQLSLTNWAAGGYGQISLSTFADLVADYAKDKIKWNNELQMGYGFIESFETGYQKSDDRLILDSKFGYKAVEKLYISAAFNMRTQFSAGYSGENVVSNIFAPANMTLGIGIDYNPSSAISINFAPLTGKTVIVTVPELRTTYGNAEDQLCRFELGAQLTAKANLAIENFKFNTSVVLISDYLNKPQNVKVTWDANVEAKISRFFSVTLRTNLIYDDTVKLTKKNKETGETYTAAGVQFKELFSIGLTYSIGSKKK